ncbi:hypothetical protein [Chryseobacterium koreense]
MNNEVHYSKTNPNTASLHHQLRDNRNSSPGGDEADQSQIQELD